MARLTLVAEPFPDWESPVQRAAARDLTDALALTAPRSCSVRYLAATDSELPPFSSARILAEHLPLRASMLPMLWQSRATARPLDGELAHSLTPMVPLRARSEDDGSQSTVTVPHMLAWEAPDLMSPSQARLTRAFVRRATKFADVILTNSYATADALAETYGADLPIQVLPLAAPREMRPGADAAERRDRLELPAEYWVTTARDDERGRLEWIFQTMIVDPSIPHLVVVSGLDPAVHVKGRKSAEAEGDSTGADPVAVPESLAGRVTTLAFSDLHYIGAVLGGASLLLQPQSFLGTGFTIIAALQTGVPVLHTGVASTQEFVLDAGRIAEDATEFGRAMSELAAPTSPDLEQLAVRAGDRGRSFSWQNTAWHLWQTHADI